MDFLEEETAGAKCTVVSASHIFDGLEKWVTHLLHISEGQVVRCEAVAPQGPQWAATGGLFPLVTGWLEASAPAAVPPAFGPAPVTAAAGVPADPAVQVEG